MALKYPLDYQSLLNSTGYPLTTAASPASTTQFVIRASHGNYVSYAGTEGMPWGRYGFNLSHLNEAKLYDNANHAANAIAKRNREQQHAGHYSIVPVTVTTTPAKYETTVTPGAPEKTSYVLRLDDKSSGYRLGKVGQYVAPASPGNFEWTDAASDAYHFPSANAAAQELAVRNARYAGQPSLKISVSIVPVVTPAVPAKTERKLVAPASTTITLL
jgi:hypothetical protein